MNTRKLPPLAEFVFDGFLKDSAGRRIGYTTELISHKVAAGLLGKETASAFRSWATRHNKKVLNPDYLIRRPAPGLVFLGDVYVYATVQGLDAFLQSRPRLSLTLQEAPTLTHTLQNLRKSR